MYKKKEHTRKKALILKYYGIIFLKKKTIATCLCLCVFQLECIESSVQRAGNITKLDKSFDCWMLRTENKADYPSMVCFRSCRYSVKISTTWVHIKWFIISSLESDNKKVTISSAQKSGPLITRSVQKHKLLLVYSPHLP